MQLAKALRDAGVVMPVDPEPQDPRHFLAFVMDICSRLGGDLVAVASELERLSTEDVELHRYLLHKGASYAAREAGTSLRADIAVTDNVTALRSRNDQRTANGTPRFMNAMKTAIGLLDMPLPRLNKTLGAATAADLADVKDYYLGLAEGFTRKGSAYRRLQEALVRSNKKTVRDLGEAKVKEILGDVGDDE